MRWLRAPAALLALSLLAAGCTAARIHSPETLDHFETMVATDDGWEVALFRLPPAEGTEEAPHHGAPVLLAHGTSVNRTNFLAEGASLGDYLAERGFDVWLMEYRGDRTSVPPDRKSWRRGEWDVDDIAGQDIPAVVDHIRAETGDQPLFWLGHSLGGILGYVTLQGPEGEHFGGIVAVGSPGSFDHPNDIALLAGSLKGAVPLGQLPSRPLALLVAPLLEPARNNRLLHVILNTDNADPARLRSFVEPGMENTGRSLSLQYTTWIEGGHLLDRDGTVDYTEGLAHIHHPALFIAGRVDHVVPPWTVREAHDRVSSPDKTFVMLGVGWGTTHDYGHGDLLVGDHVHEEVFQIIGEWLEARATNPPE